MSKKQNTKETPEQKQAARRAREAEQRRLAAQERRKKQIIRYGGIGGAAAVLLIAGVCILRNTGSRALRHKVIAETEHYEVTAAMFACYFRQCADSYLRYAQQDSTLSVYDPKVSLKDQEYSNGVTGYDLFVDNAMSTVKNNLQLAETALAEGYTLSDADEADVQQIVKDADLSRYQKGVRRSDLEKATRLTILADSYQTMAKDRINVTDDEVNSYYQAHQDEYLTVSVLAYSFPWNPEGIINGDYAEHDAALERAEALSQCKSQQEFTDSVYRYLTEEKDIERSEAEQMAANLTMTQAVRDFPEDVQEWVRNGAKRGETFVLPREDHCYASVYMLREEPAADESKTVDFRIIYMSAADFDGIENTVTIAEELQDEVNASDDPSATFAELAGEYSEDAETYPNGGLVSGYSATRTTYGDEISAWAFDRERQHGDMTIVSRTGAAILAFFEGTNDGTGWENQVRNDLYQSKIDAFTQTCADHAVTVHEKNYKYIAPSAKLQIIQNNQNSGEES